MKQTKPMDNSPVFLTREPVQESTAESAAKLLAGLQQRDNLPDSWLQDALQWYLPLATQLANIKTQTDGVLCIGINGAQGTGKSTLADALSLLLSRHHNLRTVNLSLDDFYLSRAARLQLADSTHPLLKTRGVPGTHNTALALHTIVSLKQQKAVALPRFSKATDEPLPQSEWQLCDGVVDIVILEGWCLGLKPQTADALATPVNFLESSEDSDGRWRTYVNKCLAENYQLLFAHIDYLIMLRAPGFAQVHEWRALQEKKLAEKIQRDSIKTPAAQTPGEKTPEIQLMGSAELERFIAHYERLTQHALDTLAGDADLVMILDGQHRIVSPLPVASAQPPE
jgi:D-glycerate 3-kinase